jgi:acyl-CoA synthetase
MLYRTTSVSRGVSVEIVDVVGTKRRRAWAADGLYWDRDLYSTFVGQVERWPDRAAVIDSSGEVSYAQLLGASHRVANALVAAGVEPGDIVAVQVPNSWACCALDLAVAAVGAVCLPYPSQYRGAETRALLSQAQAVAAVIGDLVDHPDPLETVTTYRDVLPADAPILTVGHPIERVTSLAAGLNGEGSTGWVPRSIDPDSPLRIMTTSGTESAPKMTAYSHNNLGRPYEFMMRAMGFSESSRVFSMGPIGAGMGSVATAGIVAALGATLIVAPQFSVDIAFDVIETHRPTHLRGVPAMFHMLLADDRAASLRDSSVDGIWVSGAAISADEIDRLHAATGWEIATAWGATDGAWCGHTLDGREPGPVGPPLPEISDLRIVDPTGRDVPAGEVGEIWVSGPFSPLGYVNAPELDAQYRTADGWTRTGDLGLIEPDGRLRIMGRQKDIIIRGGFNISPQEIEGHLVTHPAVVHAACVPEPDERLGERVCAFVTLRPGADEPTVEAVGTFLLDRGLAKHKLPERIVVLDELPTNPNGKVIKRRLAELLTAT